MNLISILLKLSKLIFVIPKTLCWTLLRDCFSLNLVAKFFRDLEYLVIDLIKPNIFFFRTDLRFFDLIGLWIKHNYRQPLTASFFFFDIRYLKRSRFHSTKCWCFWGYRPHSFSCLLLVDLQNGSNQLGVGGDISRVRGCLLWAFLNITTRPTSECWNPAELFWASPVRGLTASSISYAALAGAGCSWCAGRCRRFWSSVCCACPSMQTQPRDLHLEAISPSKSFLISSCDKLSRLVCLRQSLLLSLSRWSMASDCMLSASVLNLIVSRPTYFWFRLMWFSSRIKLSMATLVKAEWTYGLPATSSLRDSM